LRDYPWLGSNDVQEKFRQDRKSPDAKNKVPPNETQSFPKQPLRAESDALDKEMASLKDNMKILSGVIKHLTKAMNESPETDRDALQSEPGATQARLEVTKRQLGDISKRIKDGNLWRSWKPRPG